MSGCTIEGYIYETAGEKPENRVRSWLLFLLLFFLFPTSMNMTVHYIHSNETIYTYSLFFVLDSARMYSAGQDSTVLGLIRPATFKNVSLHYALL